MSKCECNIATSTPKADSSCTLESSVEIPICGMCGAVVRDCFCDYLTHDIKEDGVCIQCGLDNPGNQICEWRGEPPLQIDGTLVRKASRLNSRRNLFNLVPLHYVCSAEGVNGFYIKFLVWPICWFCVPFALMVVARFVFIVICCML